MILVVCIQRIRQGKIQETLKEVTPKYRALFDRHGFPPSKLYQSVFGSHDVDTAITAMEWESMAAMESAYNALFADPESQKLAEISNNYIESTRYEMYMEVE